MSFKVVQGVRIPRTRDLRQEFEVRRRADGQNHVIFNVSAEHIHSVFIDFVREIPELGFLVIETPCNEVRELELRKRDTDPFHRDVYYLDGLKRDEVLEIFEEYADILINDGLVTFGFGSHEAREEILVEKYKIFHLFSDRWSNYLPVFEAHQIVQVDKLVTAWNTFTEEAPGEARRWTRPDGVDIYEVIEKLMRSRGMYLAKTI